MEIGKQNNLTTRKSHSLLHMAAGSWSVGKILLWPGPAQTARKESIFFSEGLHPHPTPPHPPHPPLPNKSAWRPPYLVPGTVPPRKHNSFFFHSQFQQFPEISKPREGRVTLSQLRHFLEMFQLTEGQATDAEYKGPVYSASVA